MLKGLRYSNKPQNIDKNKLKDIYSNNNGDLVFSVSRLEKYAQCPFSYFVQYGLKAKNRKLYKFNAPDIGLFMHEILDEFTNKIRKEKIKWCDLNREKCRDIVDILVKDKVDENSILNSSERYKYFAQRFKKIVVNSVVVLSQQMSKGEFGVYSNEFIFGVGGKGAPISFTLPSGEKVYLTGRIDRIDELKMDQKTYIRIVDYKSGNKEFEIGRAHV